MFRHKKWFRKKKQWCCCDACALCIMCSVEIDVIMFSYFGIIQILIDGGAVTIHGELPTPRHMMSKYLVLSEVLVSCIPTRDAMTSFNVFFCEIIALFYSLKKKTVLKKLPRRQRDIVCFSFCLDFSENGTHGTWKPSTSSFVGRQ